MPDDPKSDALLILEDDTDEDRDGALAIGDDGDLVAFDSETGQGAECCCGGGQCCERVGEFGCQSAVPPAEKKLRKCGYRVELHMHGTESLSLTGFPEFDSDGNEYTRVVNASGAYHASVYWQLLSKLGTVCGAPTRCGTSIGLADGLNERTYTESGIAPNKFGVAEPYSLSASQQGNLAFIEPNIQFFKYRRGFDAPCRIWDRDDELFPPCHWTALGNYTNVNNTVADSVWFPLTATFFDDADGVTNSHSVMEAIYRAVGEENLGPPFYNRWINGYFEFNPDGEDIFHETDPCGGEYDPYSNYVGSGAGQFVFSWKASATANGGEYSASLVGGGPDFNVSEYSAKSAGSWTMEVIDCDGKIDDGGSDNDLTCQQFLDAFFAGDKAGDYNGDGFVNGLDFDKFVADHPDCFPDIIISRPDVVAARKRNIRVGDQITPADLLGLPGSRPIPAPSASFSGAASVRARVLESLISQSPFTVKRRVAK